MVSLQAHGVVIGLLASAVFQSVSAVLDAVTAYDAGCSVLGSISAVPGSCTSDITCANGAGLICAMDWNYNTQIAAVFSVPYITISTYTGSTCTGTPTTLKAYAADRLCHPLASTSGYFRVKIYGMGSDAPSASDIALISMFSDDVCLTPDQTTSDLIVSRSALITNSGCNEATRFEISPGWPNASMVLKASTAFDSDDCAGELGSITITPEACAGDSCASGAGTFCTSSEEYKRSECNLATLMTIQAYAADGKCHPVGSKFVRVTTNLTPGWNTDIQIFLDAVCANLDSASYFQVTPEKVNSGCISESQSYRRYEVSAKWPVFSYFTAGVFDGNDCTKMVGYIEMSPTSSCTASICNGGHRTECLTNYNYEANIAAAFGNIPYLTVSKFSGKVCTAATLTAVRAFAADGRCHRTNDGKRFRVTTSTDKQTMLITTYVNSGDYLCTTVDTATATTKVTKTVLNTNSGCDGLAIATQYKATSIAQKPSGVTLKATTAYDDGNCTKTLGSISISSGTCINDSTCVDGKGEICVNNYNYETAIATAFGTTPYVTVSYFSGVSCTWMTLETATAYAADGKCHSIGSKYFITKVVGLNAMISTYTDSSCGVLENSNTFQVTTTTSGCNSATRMRVILSSNWSTPMNVVGTYTNSTCSNGTASKMVVTDVTAGGTCSVTTQTCSGNSLSDCTSSIGYKSYLDRSFGAMPYLIKEIYTDATCTTRSSIAAYAADGTCYADGSNSFKVLQVTGGTALKLFTGVGCTTTGTTTTVTGASLLGNSCVASSKYCMGGDWMLTTTSVYDDAKCALTRSKISYTVTATCTKPTAADACKTTKSGSATVYIAPGCVKSTSYISNIDKAFGLTPYVVVESYSAQGCSGLTGVTAYVADGKCHNNAESSSYTAYSDPSTNTANIMMYSNADCGTFTTSVYSNGIESPCTSSTTSDFKKMYIGGMVSKLTATVTYSDADCTKPVQVVFASPITACSVKSTCTAATNGLYMKQGCTGDFAKYLTEIFKRTRHLVTELYDQQSCKTRQGIVAYVGDGVCHPNLDGTTSFKVTLGAANTDSATLVTYNDAVCTGTGTPLAISATNLASGLCDSATSIISTIGGESGSTAAPTTGPSTTPEPTTVTSTGSGTSSATTCLHLSKLGFMVITRGILGGIAIL